MNEHDKKIVYWLFERSGGGASPGNFAQGPCGLLAPADVGGGAAAAREYLNECAAEYLVEHGVDERVGHARRVAEPGERGLHGGLVVGEQPLHARLAHHAEQVEQEEGAPERDEHDEDDDEHLERLALV